MRIKQGDTYPFQQRLLYDDSSPVDLTDADSVNLRLRLDGATSYKVDKPCVIVDAMLGTVLYFPDTSDTDTPGMYEMEFRIIFKGGNVQTVPSNKTMWLLILGDSND